MRPLSLWQGKAAQFRLSHGSLSLKTVSAANSASRTIMKVTLKNHSRLSFPSLNFSRSKDLHSPKDLRTPPTLNPCSKLPNKTNPKPPMHSRPSGKSSIRLWIKRVLHDQFEWRCVVVNWRRPEQQAGLLEVQDWRCDWLRGRSGRRAWIFWQQDCVQEGENTNTLFHSALMQEKRCTLAWCCIMWAMRSLCLLSEHRH